MTKFAIAIGVLFSIVTILHAQDTGDVSDSGPCEIRGGTLFKPLGEISSVLSDDGLELPPDCSSKRFHANASGSESSAVTDTQFHWQPTNFFHMPAYLDDVPLERYGQSKHPHLQPIISGIKFGLQLPVLPYKMGVDHPHDCISALGHRPPGSCVPCIKQRLPMELDATLIQAGAVVGAAAALP